MLAYKKEVLDIARKRDAVEDAAAQGLISKEEKQRLLFQIPSKSFTPGLILRIGIGFGTLMATSMLSSVELLILGSLVSNPIFFLFNGIVLIFLLEMLIKERNHFRSGVDDILLYTAAPLLIGFASQILEEKFRFAPIVICLIAILVFLAAAIRYADRIMTVAILIGGFVLSYLVIEEFKIKMPFAFPIAVSTLSLIGLAIGNIQKKKDSLIEYQHCFELLEAVCLIGFFASINFQVVESLWLEMGLKTKIKFPTAHVMYMALTALVPIILFVWGWVKKELSFLRLGFVMIGISFLDFNDFLKWFPLETAFSILGGLFILIAYYFLKLYESSTGSFEFKERKTAGTRFDFENLVVGWGANMGWQSEVATPSPHGGDFGGAGAKGEF